VTDQPDEFEGMDALQILERIGGTQRYRVVRTVTKIDGEVIDIDYALHMVMFDAGGRPIGKSVYPAASSETMDGLFDEVARLRAALDEPQLSDDQFLTSIAAPANDE